MCVSDRPVPLPKPIYMSIDGMGQSHLDDRVPRSTLAGANNWTDSLSLVMTTTPYMVLVGNHEAERHSPACFDTANQL